MVQICEEVVSGSRIDTSASTRVQRKTHRIKWTIEDISNIVLDTNLIGPDFYITPALMANLSLKRSESHLYVYVCNKSDTDIQIERKIFLFDGNDKILHEDKDIKIFTLDRNRDIDMLGSVKERKKYDFLPNDKLIIDLSIGLRGEVTTEISRLQSITDPQKKLIDDLRSMQENSVNSDVSLQIGDDRVPAHWSILASRSSYFKRMFDSNMKETLENSIIITDLSLCTLRKLVKFLYTADFMESNEDNIDELFDLYYAADKYEMMDMRALCSSRIMSKATADNACQIFQLAYRHSDKILKLQAMDFIQIHSDAVFQTEGWKKFESDEPLATELLTFCLKKTKSAC